MIEKCFICGCETDDQLVRSPMPRELLTSQGEEPLPVCKKCNNLRKKIDGTFITLCEDTKMVETYRSESMKRSEYFPATLIYHIPIERLRLLYTQIVEMTEEAHNISADDIQRKKTEEELNYEWRKKDE